MASQHSCLYCKYEILLLAEEQSYMTPQHIQQILGTSAAVAGTIAALLATGVVSLARIRSASRTLALYIDMSELRAEHLLISGLNGLRKHIRKHKMVA